MTPSITLANPHVPIKILERLVPRWSPQLRIYKISSVRHSCLPSACRWKNKCLEVTGGVWGAPLVFILAVRCPNVLLAFYISIQTLVLKCLSISPYLLKALPFYGSDEGTVSFLCPVLDYTKTTLIFTLYEAAFTMYRGLCSRYGWQSKNLWVILCFIS